LVRIEGVFNPSMLPERGIVCVLQGTYFCEGISRCIILGIMLWVLRCRSEIPNIPRESIRLSHLIWPRVWLSVSAQRVFTLGDEIRPASLPIRINKTAPRLDNHRLGSSTPTNIVSRLHSTSNGHDSRGSCLLSWELLLTCGGPVLHHSRIEENGYRQG